VTARAAIERQVAVRTWIIVARRSDRSIKRTGARADEEGDCAAGNDAERRGEKPSEVDKTIRLGGTTMSIL
jgi:hypothetical protein